MKICNDILRALKIESTYILCKDILYLCYPVEIRKTSWFVSTDSDNLSGKVNLKVKYRGSFLYLKAQILKKQTDTLYSFTYEVIITEDTINTDNFKFAFFRALQEMEEKDTQWNKRKEERYDIGLDEVNNKNIQFKTPEQVIICDKIQLPCVVNNLSYNGAKVTTLEGNFSKDKKVCIKLSFINPIEQIPIVSNIRNCLIKTTKENQIISVLSVKFESVPYEYKTRLDNYIKLLENI